EAAELFLHGKEGFGVGDRRIDLEPVADDAGIGEELLHFSRVVAGDLVGVEVIKGVSIILALAEDRLPAQAGLGTFEDEELEELSIIVQRDAPLLVVVAN